MAACRAVSGSGYLEPAPGMAAVLSAAGCRLPAGGGNFEEVEDFQTLGSLQIGTRSETRKKKKRWQLNLRNRKGSVIFR